ncbi:MAG: aspartate--ammonia ligase [Oscillospiraceae bacterium]|nr:aspartate--ammonia ligase [Oscillospiraceae bacterium]MBQ2861187.1 aspartate--ammonia ligase [Oscillospiraceae bacterium]MBQ2998236.1 aspartate--ammonia ligase [Oscillospiraceae bacterium]MBQ3561845.1 aspartate--ammonia ligase [Oscillospiraceae bacterium]MBQ6802841.1 aspartate--ammonia ligase [Oscillospiraceae bacterium]
MFGNFNILETEVAIKFIKDSFERELADALNLTRVSAPLFVFPETGLNDNLSGVERPVEFDILDIHKRKVQVVQSLAKWKRLALKKYGFTIGTGLYTDMNAIRRDETLDAIHSIYVDQWDWEKVINPDERNLHTLKNAVKDIYEALKETQFKLCGRFGGMKPFLPEEITFVSTQELEDMYPDKSAKEREDAVTEKYGAVFLMQIGLPLKSGKPHDGRAPDYDDWMLNGDILVWNPVLEHAFEISSMGIRVDAKALDAQLQVSGCTERAELPFHKALLNGELPQTMGGGLGQSRICMLLLGKRHIGEVQSSIWPEEMISECEAEGIHIL